MGGGFLGGDLAVLSYVVIGGVALAVAVPVTIALIRTLNQTWLDWDWRRKDDEPGEREVPQPQLTPRTNPPNTDQGITCPERQWGTTPRQWR
jgi:hypothetical protein